MQIIVTSLCSKMKLHTLKEKELYRNIKSMPKHVENPIERYFNLPTFALSISDQQFILLQ